MTAPRRGFTTGLAALSLGVSLVSLATPASAVVPNVATGPGIVVDGSFADWTSADGFAAMYRAGDATKQVESRLYMRYDCDAAILYVGVIAEQGITIIESDVDNFVKLGNHDKLVDGADGPPDGTQPEFAYAAGRIGWEASVELLPGTYESLNVHVQVEDGGSQTSAVAGRAIRMVIACGEQGTSGTSTTFPSPSTSASASQSASTSQSAEQSVQGGTGTPAASMGNSSTALASRSSSGATVLWGAMLLASAAALLVACGRRRQPR